MREVTCVLGLVSVLITPGVTQEPTAESQAKRAQDSPLVLAEVIDDATGEPLAGFTAVPGVNPLLGIGWQWQPHQVSHFKEGDLRWPPEGLRGYRKEQVLRVEAPGYVPVLSPVVMPVDADAANKSEKVTRPTAGGGEVEFDAVWPRADRPTRFTLRMRRGSVPGRVVDHEGTPIAGAVVAAGMPQYRQPYFYQGEVWRRAESRPTSPRDRWQRAFYTESDSEGRFELPQEIVRTRVIASHPKGIARIRLEPGAERVELRLEPLGRIEGRCVWNGEPGAKQKLYLFASAHQDRTTTDSEGRFVFENVPPGEAGIGRNSSPNGTDRYVCMDPSARLLVKGGETTSCVLGGEGRPVVGRVTGYSDWRNVRVSVHLRRSWPSMSLRGSDDPTVGAFWGFVHSKIYRHYDTEEVSVSEEGVFRVDHVPAENWAVVATERKGDEILRQGESTFQIAMMPGGSSQVPKEIGAIELRADERITYPEIKPRGTRFEISPQEFELLKSFRPIGEDPGDKDK
ncbi:hypothetical protein MalM25_32400 [Planctomycetes bacterium MalM25]|nr:hypothetical protein MalM25_32400 [Planctomycetes bacterium MalM25]